MAERVVDAVQTLELTPELRACIRDMMAWSLRAEGGLGCKAFWEAFHKFSRLFSEATGIESEAYC